MPATDHNLAPDHGSIRDHPAVAMADPDARALAEVADLTPEHPIRRQVRDRVVAANLPLARRLAGRFTGRGEPVDDLVQVANLALVRAADRFDPSYGVSFAGFAGPTIVGELRHHFRDTRWQMRVDRRNQERYLSVRRATDELVQELGHQPSPAEVGARLNLDPKATQDSLATGQALQLCSLNAPLDTDGEAGELIDQLGGTDPELDRAADRQALYQLLGTLPEQDRRLLALRFFDNLTQTEIAGRIGVSQMQVSRLLTAVLARLRTALLAEE